jgi:hypothetical protein
MVEREEDSPMFDERHHHAINVDHIDVEENKD